MSNKQFVYNSMSELRPVKALLDEAGRALDDKTRTLTADAAPLLLGAATTGGIGAILAAGRSPVASTAFTPGPIFPSSVGTGAPAAIKVAAAAATAIVGAVGYYVWKTRKKSKIDREKEAYLQEAIRKQDAITRENANTNSKNAERIVYLEQLTDKLVETIESLEADLRAARGH